MPLIAPTLLKNERLTLSFQGHYDRLAKGHEYTNPRPDVLPLVAGTDYSEINNRDDFTAIYDNPMASPTTREQLLIDINDNSPQYQVPKNDFPRPELAYDNPLDLMQQRKPEQAPKQGIGLSVRRFLGD